MQVMADIQKLPYINNYELIIQFIKDLYIFNNDFIELSRINHLGKQSALIDQQINSATVYLDYIKNQQVVDKKYKSIEEVKKQFVENLNNENLNNVTDIDDIDIFDNSNQQNIKFNKEAYPCLFNDSRHLLEDSFPYPNIRPAQQKILQLLRKCDDKKFILIEAMPGTGKSAIAKTIASHFGSGYILTATKQLQDQYTDEFFDVVAIKGKSSYPCDKARFETCKSGPCINNVEILQKCRSAKSCPYLNAKMIARAANITVTSYAYFFTWLNSMVRQNFSSRAILVLDEAHLLDAQMTSWTELVLNPVHLNEKYHISDYCERLDDLSLITAPTFEENYTAINKRIINIVYELLKKVHKAIVADLNLANINRQPNSILQTKWGDNKDAAIQDVQKRYKRVMFLKETLDQVLVKLQLFQTAENKNEWLLFPQENDVDRTNELMIKPLYMSKLFRKFVEQYGTEHIVFMSATILNARLFCEELGIRREEVAIIRQDSVFDPQRSPILYNPVGKMSYAHLQATMPKIIEMIRKILVQHKNDKGIIHTGNYSIAQKICSYIKDKRLMMKTGYEDNETLLHRHAKTKNGVLVSPSLGTGTDLKDDAARFQVIVKLPFMSLADKRVKRKAELNNDWYNCEMLRALIQASGRATRSEEDYSVTYILDSSFQYWVQKYSAWLPKSFLNRIHWSGSIGIF